MIAALADATPEFAASEDAVSKEAMTDDAVPDDAMPDDTVRADAVPGDAMPDGAPPDDPAARRTQPVSDHGAADASTAARGDNERVSPTPPSKISTL